MNRRFFITRVTQGVAAAVVLAHVPIQWVPNIGGVKKGVALDYLRKAYNEWCAGKGGRHPYVIIVGRDLYEAAESEMICNSRIIEGGGLFIKNGFEHHGGLAFKDAALTYRGPGWHIVSISETMDEQMLKERRVHI